MLCEIENQRSDGKDDEHHRHEQLAAEARDARFALRVARVHGKSTRKLAPLFNSIDRSSVVALFVQAFNV